MRFSVIVLFFHCTKNPFSFHFPVVFQLPNRFLHLFLNFSTPTEAECIFHEMLHKWSICKSNKIPCPLCNRTFGKNSLRCHLRCHTNERIFKCECDDCDLKFTRKSNLKQHIERIHLNKRSTAATSATSASRAAKTKTTKPSTSKVKCLAKQSLTSPLFSCSICQKRFRKK